VDDTARIDTINQIFALFRINYHNQFYSAFTDTALLNQAKRLWLESLRYYSTECLLKAARQVIEQSEYLPTLNKMIEACNAQSGETGLPSAREAFMEACMAPTPRTAHSWTHPAVYHAGAQTGWYELETRPEYVTWPRFEKHYDALRRRVLKGEELVVDDECATIEQKEQSPLDKSEGLARIQALRGDLDL